MKRNKVLIGLILAAFVGAGAISVAQTKANYQNNLFEIGPDNVGGRVRAIVADQSDPEHKTLYAGGVAGGLYKWSADATNWEYIPYEEQGNQITLPISYLHQAGDNMIYIATGEGMMLNSSLAGLIVPEGRGLFAFNPEDQSFALVNGSAQMKYINRIASLYRDGKLYLYAATTEGLYRWVKSDGAQWGSPETIFTENAVQDIKIVSGDNMAFFTSGGNLFKVSNVTAATNTYTDITSSCSDFGGDNTRIELAVAKCDKTYLYAMVTNKSGLLKGVYLTTNQTRWTKLTTATITPFDAQCDGWHASSITIDPTNAKMVYIGGSTLWVGQGFSEDAFYQWTQCSNNENTLNRGNAMEQVLGNPAYVHSGIHHILPVRSIEGTDTTWHFYMATDGGIFKTTTKFNSFVSQNKGFNTVQYNGIAVSPDGSVTGGAVGNACTFIQSRHAHNGAATNNTWYDNRTAMNHTGATVWYGDGGRILSSMFQQITPLSRRGILFSNCGTTTIDYVALSNTWITIPNIGRSYGDYFDYTNTQTWTIGEDFMHQVVGSFVGLPTMALYETTNNLGQDSITFTIDTLGNFIHNGQLTNFQDLDVMSTEYVLTPGDKLIVPSRPHFNYPFEYTVTSNLKVGDNMTLTVPNPVASRLYLGGLNSDRQGIIYMTTAPFDFTRVGYNGQGNKGMEWSMIYKTGTSVRFKVDGIGEIIPTTDGDALIVDCIDSSYAKSYIVRIHNLNAVSVNNKEQMDHEVGFSDPDRITIFDTIRFDGENYRFNRRITSFSLVNRNGHDNLLVAFGEGEGEYNVCYIENVNDINGRTLTFGNVANGKALYSCLIEKTTGKLFVGNVDGVYTATAVNGTWTAYGDFGGAPVTSICQQTQALQRQYYLGHAGISEEHYLFAKTKYPNAIYFGTYGRGIFMDMEYVTDTVNEISDPSDWAGIQTIDNGLSRINVYPNPATDHATIDIAVAEAGNASIRVYDLTGRCVVSENLGSVSEGTYTYQLDTKNLRHGMYLINVNVAGKTATKKLVVK